MIEVRAAQLDDAGAVREVGLKTWPVAYGGLVPEEFIVDGQLVGMVGLGREGDHWAGASARPCSTPPSSGLDGAECPA